jgi:hypothetical protein
MKFKIGDKFVYGIESMKENGYGEDQYDNEVHEVCSVEYHEGLGEIVGWWDKDNEFQPAQCHADWLTPVVQ